MPASWLFTCNIKSIILWSKVLSTTCSTIIFSESYEEVQEHAHDIGERLHGLGGVPALTFGKLADLCCFEQESDDVFRCRVMIEHDMKAEQSITEMLRRLASQAESLGDRGTRHLLRAGTSEDRRADLSPGAFPDPRQS